VAPTADNGLDRHLLVLARAIVGDNGNFNLRLPAGGDYYLLVISEHAKRTAEKPVFRDLAELGRYVSSAYDLIGRSDYRWTRKSITKDERLHWELGPAAE